MLVAITLSMALFATPAPSPSDPAELLPAGSLLYVGTDSIKAGSEASKNTAMSKILDEAEVRAFLHRPTRAAEAVMKLMMEQASSELGDMPGLAGLSDSEMNLELDLNPSESVGLSLGQGFVALTHFAMPSESTPMPDVGLVVGVQLFDKSQISILKGMWSAIPSPDAAGQYGGVDYSSKLIPETPMSVQLAFLGDLAVVSLSEESLHGIIDRFQGKAPSGSSLAESSDFRAMLKAAGGSTSGGMTSFMRVGSLMEIARQGVVLALVMDGGGPEQLQAVDMVFDGLGLDAIRMAGGTSAVGKDGLIYSTSVVSLDHAAAGLLPSMMGSVGTLAEGSLGQIPGDAISASLWTMGSELVSVYDFGMQMTAAIEGPEQSAGLEMMLAAMLGGASLRDDLLGNLHGESMYYSVPGQGFTGAPESVFKIGVRDGEKFVSLLEALLALISSEGNMPVKLTSTEDEQGTKLYELDLSQTPAGALMKPSFAIRDGEMYASDQMSRLKSVMKSGPDEAKSLGKNTGLSAFLKGLGEGVELQSVGFANNAEGFSTQYGQVAQFLPMVGAMAGNIPVDFAKLPPEKTITQYLGESYSAQYTDASGLFVNHEVTQFQASDFLPIVLVAGLVGLGQAEPQFAPSEISVEEEALDPAKQAQLDLRELKAACTVYKISTGGYPESLGALLEPLPDYEEGALPRDSLPTDPWGNPYYFALEVPAGKTKAKPKLWSAGANGVNENGEGDDILKF